MGPPGKSHSELLYMKSRCMENSQDSNQKWLVYIKKINLIPKFLNAN